MRKALISGASGQDGFYLASLLLNKKYDVTGLVRSPDRPVALGVRAQLVDVTSESQIRNVVEMYRPDEIYHLATGHEVGFNTDDHALTKAIDTDSTLFFLKAISDFNPQTKFFYASSSRVFGAVQSSPQGENYPLNPISEYAKAKVASMELVKHYRKEKNIFACSGILFNHESPRRNPFFLPRKITQAVAKIKLGLEKELYLGDIESRRDWGYAGDFVLAMWMMLQVNHPTDYVIGSGKTHAVKDILKIAFSHVGLNWTNYVKVRDDLKRAPEPYEVVADIAKIKTDLGWEPSKKFDDMITEMVDVDLQLLVKN